MFALPMIAPSPDYSLFLSSHIRQYETSHPQLLNPGQQQQHNTNAALQLQQQQLQQRNQPVRNNPLAQLKADEETIRKRKENIARFGSTWIKPPGVSKTLQAETEERLEREEQEALARREQMMADLAARQAEEEAREQARANDEAADGRDGMMDEDERDLDEDVPDADEVDLDDEDEEDESEEEDDLTGTHAATDEDGEDGGGVTEGNITFGEESLLEGSMIAEQVRIERVPVEVRAAAEEEDNENSGQLAEREELDQERYVRLEEAEVTGVAQDQYELDMDANLDDSVPEAGSYQHTDTELEDSDSDDDEDQSSMLAPPRDERASFGHRQSFMGRRSNVSRQSMRSRDSIDGRTSLREGDVSSLLESSFVGSSPMLGRLRSANVRPRRSQ